MQVKVKLFARLRELAGTAKLETQLGEGATVSELLARLCVEFPRLENATAPMIVSVNRQFVPFDTQLHDGDEVALFPPVSGGADSFRLTQNGIEVSETISSVVCAEMGAVAVFVGVVRNSSEDKPVTALEYEAYEEMAVAKMRQIAEEARARWPKIGDIAIVQRIGHLRVGEPAVVIAVASPHRHEGCFEACHYAIDRLKQIAPIWKKEIGPLGEAWVEGEYVPSDID
jgi:molybdopterin converting factor subunit 1